MNNQRKVIFEQRKKILRSENITEIINSFLEDVIKDFLVEKDTIKNEYIYNFWYMVKNVIPKNDPI